MLEYFLLGFAISAVPGAVLIEAMRRSVSAHHTVIRFLIGNFSGMLLVMAVTYFGVTRLLSGPVVSVLFYALSAMLLIYLGLSAIRANPTKRGRTGGRHAAFIVGFSLAVANPLSIVFWVSTMARIISDYGKGLRTVSILSSIFLGSMVLFAIVVYLVSVVRTRLHKRHLVMMSKTFGVILIGFGLIALWHAFRRLALS